MILNMLILLLSNAMRDLCKGAECFISTNVVSDTTIDNTITTWHTSIRNNFVYYTKLDIGESSNFGILSGDSKIGTFSQLNIDNVTSDICARDTCWIRIRSSNDTILGGINGYYDYTNSVLNLYVMSTSLIPEGLAKYWINLEVCMIDNPDDYNDCVDSSKKIGGFKNLQKLIKY